MVGLDVYVGYGPLIYPRPTGIGDDETPAKPPTPIDKSTVQSFLDKMKPMSVKQAHAACQFGISAMNGLQVLKSSYGGFLSGEQDKRLSDLKNFDALIDSAHVDPLPDDTRSQIVAAVLASVDDYNGTGTAIVEIPEKAKEAVKAVGQAVVDAGKGLASAAGGVFSTVKWIIIGAGILVALVSGVWIYSKVKK